MSEKKIEYYGVAERTVAGLSKALAAEKAAHAETREWWAEQNADLHATIATQAEELKAANGSLDEWGQRAVDAEALVTRYREALRQLRASVQAVETVWDDGETELLLVVTPEACELAKAALETP